MTDSLRLASPQLSWGETTLHTEQFDDYYFNSDDGAAETRHVFIDKNRIVERFAKHQGCFTIAETGFGSGANLFHTLAAIEPYLTCQRRLQFVSSENYPLSRDDLARAAKYYLTEQQIPLFEQLLRQYPEPVKGVHTIKLLDGQVTLTLLLGDSLEMYQQFSGLVDAWYLDGFTPSRNPDMWQQALYQRMAELSKVDHTSFATFTAAGHVRRGLAEAGFAVNKAPGHREKREMAYGGLVEQPTATAAKPWFNRPNSHRVNSVVVIGAGLAGCCTAYSLAQRGIKVTLLERSEDICSGGSGNRQGALYAKLAAKPTQADKIHLAGFDYTRQLLANNNWLDGQTAELCGLLQLAYGDKELARQQRWAEAANYPESLAHPVTAEKATELSGQPLEVPALYFPTAGWAHPRAMCEQLINSPLIELHCQQNVSALTATEEGWRVEASDCFNADAVVVASANQAAELSQLAELPIKPIRGQVSHAPMPESEQLKTVVCAEGYISPALEQQLCFGASYELHCLGLDMRAEEQQQNLEQLSRALPQLASALDTAMPLEAGRVSYRCASRDYLPLIGPVADSQGYQDQYAQLAKDRRWRFENQPAPLHNNLYVSCGHGSKGLLTCPIGGEIIAALISNEALPVELNSYHALHPGRFIIKNLIKGTL